MKSISYAVKYAEHGYRVFPLINNKKEPAISGWQEQATTDPEIINSWWSKNPNYNVGVVADQIILDVDVGHQEGVDGFATLEKYEKLPDTFCVDTPSGGRHYYYITDQAEGLTTRAGIDEGLDIRAGGKGYVVGAGSSIDGKPYIASDDSFQAVEAPLWLCDLAKQPKSIIPKVNRVQNISSASTEDIQQALDQLDPNLSYDEWVQVGMAIHSELPDSRGMELWNNWSSRGINYKPGECDYKWSTFEQGGGITIATLFSMVGGDKTNNSPLDDRNDATLGDRILGRYRDSILFLSGTEEWCIWDGYRWIRGCDARRQVGAWLNETIDVMAQESLELFSIDHGEAANQLNWLSRAKNQNKREAVLRYLKERTSIPNTKLDSNPDLLGVANGVIDLSTGGFREVRKQDLITRYLGSEYQPSSVCPRWLDFLRTVMEGDGEMVAYLQRLVGYWLTTEVSEQEIYFVYGEGGNGKSTFLDTVKALLGNYAVRIASESVMRNRWGTRSNSALANIAQTAGARMALTDEINDTDTKLDVGLVKSFSGDAEIQGKLLHKNPITFQATAKLVMYGNDKPYGDFTDKGLWRRMRLLHFGYEVPIDKRDKRLLAILHSELPGILNWALEGYKYWKEGGLQTPNKVIRDSEAYRNELDNVTTFLEIMVEYEPEQFTRSSAILGAYKRWCEDNGETPRRDRTFQRAVKSHLTKKPSVEGGSDGCARGYRGVALNHSMFVV